LLPTRTLLAALVTILTAAAAPAADAVTVTDVKVGFPHADPGRDPLAKFGTWAPVFAQLQVNSEVGAAELLVEAPDADDVGTSLVVPIDLSGIPTGTKVSAGERGAVGYVRVAGQASEVTVTVRAKGGAAISAPFRVKPKPREPLVYAVLAVGGMPAGFELPKAATSDAGPLRGGRVELARTDSLADLPDQWFGYDGVDLVLINTGGASPDLLTRLFASEAVADAKKREALFEWVRRGGRLVVSVGANAAAVAKLPHLTPVLPYAVKPDAPGRTADVIGLYWSAGGGGSDIASGPLGAKDGPKFALANLVPHGKPARVLSPPPGRSVEDPEPVAVQTASGLGRVTVIGFDLDREPFASFPKRPEFWDWVLREGGSPRASAGGDAKPRPLGALTEDEDEAAVAVRQHNDTFDGVTVVSFGWIAMLIALYIVLIGPVEYYFLKRVFGRLELTWVTFPVIVLTVSAAAYLSADAIKGRDLKVNKLDVVDVDVASKNVHGTTWFTVFSPKIDKYTVAVTPGREWGENSRSGATVGAIGAPRGGRPGVVRRKYAVHTDGEGVADSLEGVPVQVWSTKAFAASWSAVDLRSADAQKRVDSDLTHPPGDLTKVIGTFKHNLPVPVLTDCVAFYAGDAYPLPGDVILSGQRVRLVLDQAQPATQWLQTNGQTDLLLGRVQSYAERPGQKAGQRVQPQALSGPLPMLGVLFHEATLKNEEGSFARNASVRRLDQSWRLSPDNRDEVIIVGRAVPQTGPAEDVLTGPNAASKLWLKGRPGDGERWKIPGTARQETWVRFFLPVRQ
jgi:hypothetical protein